MTETKKEYNPEEFGESNFGIRSKEDLKHIFSVMRNKIYSNKILAVLREYSTNACDAHIESNQRARPIEVTLPVTGAPVLKIRDYGTGLSENDIRNVYAMYGASTKRGSSELNGQLGFGSKAAFSYSNSYTIVSYHEGKENIYEAYVDDNTELGAITLLSSTPTDKPSGIEIRVTVQLTDIPNFRETAGKLYKHFTVTPIVTNGLGQLKIDKPSYKLRGTTWGLRDQDGHSHSVENMAVMGNVAYPLSKQVLQDNLKNHPDWKKVEQLLACPVDFFVPVGQLSIAASREALEYDKKSLRAISELLTTAIKEITDEFTRRVAACNDLVEARARYKLITHGELRALAGLITNSKEGISYKGTRITDYRFALPSLTHDVGEEEDETVTSESSYTVRLTERQGKSTEVKTSWLNHGREFEISDESKIFIQNTDDKPILRIRNYLEKNPTVKRCHLFKPQAPNGSLANLSTEMGIPEKYFISLVGIDPMKIEAASKADSPHKAKHARKVFRMIADHNPRNHGYADSTYWEPITIDGDQEYYYVYLDRFMPQFATNARSVSNSTFRESIAAIEQLTGTNIRNRIIGIKLSAADRVLPTWKNVRTVLEEGLTTQLSNVVPRIENASYRNLRQNQTIAYLQQSGLTDPGSMNAFPVTSPMRVLLTRFRAAESESGQNTNLLDRVRQVAGQLGVTIPTLDAQINTASARVTDHLNQVLNRYPMLRLVGGGYGFRADANFRLAVTQYVNLVDSQTPNTPSST